MSKADNLLTGLRIIAARPDFRTSVEDAVRLVLEYVKDLAEDETPALLMPLRPLEELGGEAVVHFVLGLVDSMLRGLEPAAKFGKATLALTVKDWPPGLPQSPFESLPDGGGIDRNQE